MSLFKPKPDHRAAVRMYCQGFGDCFLLAFSRPDKDPLHIVIDCGLVFRTKNEKERMQEVVSLLKDHTGGKIDILIVTHEHYDHLCGFNHAKDLWKTFKIGQLWLAWTEDPDDDAADNIRIYKTNAMGLVVNAMARLPLGADERAQAESLLDSMRIPGEEDANPGDSLGLMAAYSKLTGKAMDVVTSLYDGTPKYLSPGQVELLDGTGIHAITLGPPKNPEKIGDLLGEPGDTFGHLEKELAVTAEELRLNAPATPVDYEDGLRRALGIPDAEDKPKYLFANQYCFPVKRELGPDEKGDTVDLNLKRWHSVAPPADKDKAPDDPRERYERINESWRRIDGAQYGLASRLAMQLDSLTNNISLALAFRLDASTTLLFPGDAQVGNWKSWEDQKYVVEGKEIDVSDLMRSVRVYKVGHHASHNGTCRPERFDKMPSGLKSFMPFEPVSQWPSIPSGDLVLALEAKGPVARSDQSDQAGDPFEKGDLSTVTGRPAYVDLHVK